jgi:hypothetical protein
MIKAMMLSATHNSYYIGRHNWRDTKEYERMQRTGSFKGSSLGVLRLFKKAPCSSMTFFGATAILESVHIYLKAGYASNNRRTPTTPDFGVWVEGKQGSKEGTFLVHGSERTSFKTFCSLHSFVFFLYLSNCVYQYNKNYGLPTASLKEGTFLAHGSEGIMKDIWQHNRKDTNEVNRPIYP